jgi:ectoine hydroxylase-related dioxygenase (phytanoyl-CoA dioxygenase family)
MYENESTFISEEKKKLFHEMGYAVFENVIAPEDIELLKEECDRLVAETDFQLEMKGIENESISIGMIHRHLYYLVPALKKSEKLGKFIFSELTEKFCRAFLGDNSYLYYDAFSVKYPRGGLPIVWHQDSASISESHVNWEYKPLITLWCSLDDADNTNGTLRVLPYERAGTKEMKKHVATDPLSAQRVGYFGDDPGDIIEVPAGSIVAMSGTTFHSSGLNTSERIRRAYSIIYSVEPILNSYGDTRPRTWAKAFLKNGIRVD